MMPHHPVLAPVPAVNAELQLPSWTISDTELKRCRMIVISAVSVDNPATPADTFHKDI